MTVAQKKEYKILARRVTEAAEKHYCNGIYRIRNVNPARYNNALKKMKDFLNALDGDFSNNRFMKAEPLELFTVKKNPTT